MPRSLRVGRPARRRPKMTATDPAVAFVGGRAGAWPDAVFVPGLGAPGYLMPWVRRLGGWARGTGLAPPGGGWGRARSPPADIGRRRRRDRRPVAKLSPTGRAGGAFDRRSVGRPR